MTCQFAYLERKYFSIDFSYELDISEGSVQFPPAHFDLLIQTLHRFPYLARNILAMLLSSLRRPKWAFPKSETFIEGLNYV